MKAFENAASTLTTIDVKTDNTLRKQVFKLLDKKYPEFAGDRLDQQLDENGFCYALKDSATNTIVGFAAGVVYDSKSEQDTLNTAAFTYVAVKDNNPAATAKLNADMLEDLKSKRNVSAVFVEAYNENETSNMKRNKADAQMYADMGLVKVPIIYGQPVDAESDFAYQNLDLHVLFTSPQDANDRTAITLAHLTAFTKAYDEELENPINVRQLANYKAELAGYDWGLGPKASGPALKL